MRHLPALLRWVWFDLSTIAQLKATRSNELVKRKEARERKLLKLHVSFAPELLNRVSDGGYREFYDFYFAASEHVRKLQQKEFAKKKSRLAELQTARDKTLRVFRDVLQSRTTPQEAAEKLKRLVPDKDLLREVFDIWRDVSKRTPEEAAAQSKELAQRELELARDTKRFKARCAFEETLRTLTESVEQGDAKAAKELAELAFEATLFLEIAQKKKPDLLRTVARTKQMWPVMASDEDGWERKAARRIADLGVGEDARAFNVRFRKARGADTNLPARQWAKAAVRTIEETRLRFLVYGSILREFRDHGAFADFCINNGWTISKEPQWVDDITKVGQFSKESLPIWKRAVRKMIREEMPEFHKLPEWKVQRETAAASGRTTRGELQNAILDDITSALQRLVPD